jgi:hypothetical protein
MSRTILVSLLYSNPTVAGDNLGFQKCKAHTTEQNGDRKTLKRQEHFRPVTTRLGPIMFVYTCMYVQSCTVSNCFPPWASYGVKLEASI